MKHPYLISRLCTLSMALVLLALTGLAIWTAMLTDNLTSQTRTENHISDLYQQVSTLIASEETIDWHYQIEPGQQLRLQENSINTSLTGVFGLLSSEDRSIIQQLQDLQLRYFFDINTMFTAIDQGNRTQGKFIDTLEVDPMYTPMTQLANTANKAHATQAAQSLNELNQIQRTIFIGTPLAFGLSLTLLGVLWATSRFYQRRFEQEAQDEIARLIQATLTDQLTGLGNYHAYQQDMQREVERACEQGNALGLALIDLDELKTINVESGHLEGDRILSTLGTTLLESKPSLYSYRLEGDEFALILPDTTLTDATEALDQLRMDTEHSLAGATVSVGLTVAETGGGDTETIYQQADAALIEAKRRGRNTVVAFEEIRGHVALISSVKSHAFRRLLAEGNVSVVFQPIWDLKRGRLLSFEALTRPAALYGFAGPQEAFNLAEQFGQAHKLDAICIRAILARAAELPADSLLFLNLTPQTLVHDLLTSATLLEATISAGLSPSRVVLEITERSIVEVDEVVQKVKDLRLMGFQVALDDAGAGNAGLEMLSRLPVDFVKIDNAVVNRALTDRAAYSVLVGIIAIAREAHIAVIAEGIETLEMLALVQRLKVQYGQGYLLGRPSASIPDAGDMQNLLPFLRAGSPATVASTDEAMLNPLHDVHA